jgi:hypothetical protein
MCSGCLNASFVVFPPSSNCLSAPARYRDYCFPFFSIRRHIPGPHPLRLLYYESSSASLSPVTVSPPGKSCVPLAILSASSANSFLSAPGSPAFPFPASSARFPGEILPPPESSWHSRSRSLGDIVHGPSGCPSSTLNSDSSKAFLQQPGPGTRKDRLAKSPLNEKFRSQRL